MEYLQKHINKLQVSDRRYKIKLLSFSMDGAGTKVSGLFTYVGVKYYFYRDELELA